MRTKSLIAAATALSLVAPPVLANPASRLSIANAPEVRASSDLKDSSKVAPGLFAVLGIALGIGLIIVVTEGDDEPDSP